MIKLFCFVVIVLTNFIFGFAKMTQFRVVPISGLYHQRYHMNIIVMLAMLVIHSEEKHALLHILS